MKVKTIITGATGMVGEGVLAEALSNPDVEKVLVINRKPCGVAHPKLTEIIHADFFDLTPVSDRLSGYNACFFCAGVSSVGMKNEQYYSLTYTLTMNVAETLSKLNSNMIFCYVSGAGTDSSEKGKVNWARVKGKTENDLMKLPFSHVYAFRPGFMHPSKDAKKARKVYLVSRFLYPPLRVLFPNFISTLQEVGVAMIKCVTIGYEKPVLEVKDIVELAKR